MGMGPQCEEESLRFATWNVGSMTFAVYKKVDGNDVEQESFERAIQDTNSFGKAAKMARQSASTVSVKWSDKDIDVK